MPPNPSTIHQCREQISEITAEVVPLMEYTPKPGLIEKLGDYRRSVQSAGEKQYRKPIFLENGVMLWMARVQNPGTPAELAAVAWFWDTARPVPHMKAWLEANPGPAQYTPYAPCPCGSGNKWKFCCRPKSKPNKFEMAARWFESVIREQLLPDVDLVTIGVDLPTNTGLGILYSFEDPGPISPPFNPFAVFITAMQDGKTVEIHSPDGEWRQWLGGHDFDGRDPNDFRVKE